MAEAIRDQNHVAVGLGVSSSDSSVTLPIQIDPSTGRLKVDAAGGGGGYTNLTQFVDQTAWRLFYSNGDGDVIELALGTDGTYLRSNGAAAAPTWDTPGGAGTVTSVAMSVPTGLLVSGSPITGAGTFAVTLDTGYEIFTTAAFAAKAPLASPTFTTSINGAFLTASEILITDASKNIVSAPVATYPSLTELTYLKNVTSPIQTQIDALSSAVVLKGLWDASAGTFPGAGVAQAGWSYIVSVGGTVDGVVFDVNDRIVAIIDNASTTVYANNWFKLDYTDQVLSVFGRTGAVVAVDGDYSQSLITGLKTSDSPQFAAVNIGAASDTTISRSEAGVLAVEGVVIPSISSTNTLTNKRITKRTGTTTSSATPTINTDNVDFYSLTAQAADITSFTTNLSGTPTEGQTLWIAITGTGARAITWGASFEASTVALPTTTVTTNRLDVGFVWNTVTSKWRCVASC
jgi:hypothetical protein